MILIADSGSSKTDWRLIDYQGNITQFETQGLNPNFTDDREILAVLQQTFNEEQSGKVADIFFYGSGCGNPANVTRMQHVLHDVFGRSRVEVESDMLGAARALCGHQPGMAAILGTGMNSAVYDGEKFTRNHFSLGYIMGDEGSGAYLGKQLLTHILRGSAPQQVIENFNRRFQLTNAQIIEHIYRKPHANRFMAQFAKFIYQNLKQPFLEQLVIDAFRAFFKTQIKTYDNWHHYQLHLCGSVAFYFSNILRRVAAEEGVTIGTILEKPIAALALFHSED